MTGALRIALTGAGAAAAVAGLALLPLALSDYGISLLISILSYWILTTAWALFSGPTRYVSLATSAFFGVGAYLVAWLVKGMPLQAIFALAAAAGLALALLVGLATLRVSGMYFVIFTCTRTMGSRRGSKASPRPKSVVPRSDSFKLPGSRSIAFSTV